MEKTSALKIINYLGQGSLTESGNIRVTSHNGTILAGVVETKFDVIYCAPLEQAVLVYSEPLNTESNRRLAVIIENAIRDYLA